MAGNLQADNSGNILVEFDYNNLIVVDPNKTIDAFGKISERLVDAENLVMYANLEAEVVPRTKLSVGGSPEDRIRTISVAKINFLKPTKNNFLDTGYYDEMTGENSTKYQAVNQPKETVNHDSKNKPYYRNSVADETNVIDNGLLGITSINIQTSTSFVPTVTINLEDVQGKALFQLGNNSPYSAFFNLPYCPFYLTLKGYYGQAIRYQLNLETFNARFNSYSGNYSVELKFKGYKFNILNEIALGHLFAVPHMYSQTFNVSQATTDVQTKASSTGGQPLGESQKTTNASNSNNQVTTSLVSEKGYQKIVEVYSEYKSKGLIPPDFPELTLVQLMNKLETFEQSIVNSYPKVNVEPLTNIRTYKENVKTYFNIVRGSQTSWFNTYMSPKALVLNNGRFCYTFKENLDADAKSKARAQLEGYITDNNKKLSENPTLGTLKGTAPIPNPLKFDWVEIQLNFGEIDWKQTTLQQTGILSPTQDDINKVIQGYGKLFLPTFDVTQGLTSLKNEKTKVYVFEGSSRFDEEIASLETQANKKLSEFETKITADLANKLEDSATGIGFKPTVRNMLAVIMASAEGFIRLLDDVHTNAWDVKYDPIRKNAILDNPSSAPSPETRDDVKLSKSAEQANQGIGTAQIPVYPWPQFFVETPQDKRGRFQLKYIGDPSVVNLTKGYLYDKWPEVQFVEEYMKGLTQKFNPPIVQPPIDSEANTNILNINAIEFPSNGLAYANKEEIKFFYEIWERQYITSHYSGLIRAQQNQIDELLRLNYEIESSNIFTSVNISAPYLSLKLKNYDLTAANYSTFLKNISNTGTGRAYQDYIRDFYVTPYLKGITENSFTVLNADDLGKIPQLGTNSLSLENLVKGTNNTPLIVDTIPYTDPTWVRNNMALSSQNGRDAVYNTNNVLQVFKPRNVISNFQDVYNYSTNRPVTNFSFLNVENPVKGNVTNNINPITSLRAFYETREPKNFIPTEGYVSYLPPTATNIISTYPVRTTTSILNTPYFVNAILNGVYEWRKGNKNPYVQAAYLFINSLPLASLRERYQSQDKSDLDYISSCFKKYGAIHKMPYAWILKYGSIWHRYKKFKETNVDILTTAWQNFDYTKNYSPKLNSTTQEYSITIPPSVANNNPQKINMVLQKEEADKITMNVGFYPKVINDFNVFYNGYDLYVNYTDQEIQSSINNGLKLYNFETSNYTVNQGIKPLTLQTWSVLLKDTIEDTVVSSNVCVPNAVSGGDGYFMVPSFGSTFNQSKELCTSNNLTILPITNNPEVYNGSVRLLWSAPNYGYFDNAQVVKPDVYSYVNTIVTGNTQSPFKLLNKDEYSRIEEIFSVFEKPILDKFEAEFLNFSRAMTDSNSGLETVTFYTSTVNTNAVYRNFQSLFKQLMTIPAKTASQSESEYFLNSINSQFDDFTTTIQSFMQYDVILRYGNPSNFRRRIFDSYLSYNTAPVITDPIQFKPYVKGSLPSKTGSVTLSQSQSTYPLPWRTLELEVGFSTIDNVKYSNYGSYITDFFIDNDIEFAVDNITLLAPLIKMYATQKLLTPTLTSSQFKQRLSNYQNQCTDLQNNILNGVMDRVRAKLPNQQQLPEKAIQSVISGEQSKIENYEVFKALNDKWIAGSDFKSKTLFEDMMFLDRASRNIGDVLLVDIFEMKNMLSTANPEKLNMSMSVFTFISGFLIKNNFTVMNLPAYVNFYNVQDVDGLTTPKPEGSLEFANSMWGTYLNVDYRNSGPKMICFYVGKPSQYLDLPKGNFRFRDDAFEMRRASENPLIEDVQNKKDWSVSNRCVGFTVDIGIRNQNIFYSFSVDQSAGKATSESIQAQLDMVDQASGRSVATQNVSLYNLYKQRSYKCSVTSLGNAMLQPMMYFNLRHVPMFNGPYLIQDVSHSITPGQFQTTFTGTRQGVFDLPAIDNFLQSMNQNLLTKIEELLKVKKDETSGKATTDNVKSTQVVQKANNQKAAPNSCEAGVLDVYKSRSYQGVDATLTSITPQTLADAIKARIPNNTDLQTIIYEICYVRTFEKNSNTKEGNFNGFNNNFATITLNNNYGATIDKFQKQWSCLSLKANSPVVPIANFADLNTFIDFMSSRLSPRVSQIINIGILKYYVCFWTGSDVSESYYDANKSLFDETAQSFVQAQKSAQSVGLKKIGTSTGTTTTSGTTSGTTITSGTTSGTTTTVKCLPPTITSFSPIDGPSGKIIVIKGTDLETTKQITFLNITADTKTIVIIDNKNVRVAVPTIDVSTIPTPKGKIKLTTLYGTTESKTDFTYNPNVPNQSSAAPTTNSTQSQTIPAPPNTQPQQTGAPTMISTETKVVRNLTDELIVYMNPNTPPAIISTAVIMEVSVYNNTVENNVVKKTLVQTATSVRDNLVTNNVFKVTYKDVANLLINYPIPPFNTSPINARDTVLLRFTLNAQPVDRVKYPQSVTQSFNFTFAEY